MEMKFCQSCGMPLTDDNKGINADGSRNEDYCIYCYKDGKFAQDMTMEQMIDHCAQFTDEINRQSRQNLTVEQMKEQMRQFFPHLKRWKKGNDVFPFSDAPNTAVFICSHILDCGEEILYVSHDADDGAWQFLCGKKHNESDARIVSLKYVFDLDPTIGNLKDLPLGYCAERDSKNDKWVIAKN